MDTLAGYSPTTNVWMHAMTDLDHKKFEELLAAGESEVAKAIWRFGEDFHKSAGPRIIQRFSTCVSGARSGTEVHLLYSGLRATAL